jgi:hypothetical protein
MDYSVNNIYICVNNYQPTFDTYINIWNQMASYIPQHSSYFHCLFATNISFIFHISFKPPELNQFTRPFCVLCSTRLSKSQFRFKISYLISYSLPCHVIIIYTCTELQSFTRYLFRNVLTVSRTTRADKSLGRTIPDLEERNR